MSDWQKGFYSDRPLADIPPGSQEWQGANERDRVSRSRQLLNQWQPSSPAVSSSAGEGGGSSDSGGGLIAIGLFVLFAYACLHGSHQEQWRAVAGQSYRVRPCQFTDAGVNSRVLADNEWVRVQAVHGQALDVAAYRRPYDGTSVRGKITAACVKQ